MTDRRSDISLRRQRWFVTGATALLLGTGAALAFAGGGWSASGGPLAGVFTNRPLEAPVSRSATSAAPAPAPAEPKKSPAEPKVETREPASSLRVGTATSDSSAKDGDKDQDSDKHETVKPRVRDRDKDGSDHDEDDEDKPDEADKPDGDSDASDTTFDGNDLLKGFDSKGH